MTKKCTRCGEEKELEEFGAKKINADGRDTRCKKCLAELKREWVARPKKEKEAIPEGFHKCSKCGEIKLLEDFRKNAKCKDGYTSVCNVCRGAYNEKWKAEHREQHLATRKAWYNANLEKEHKRMLAYHKKNYTKIYTKYREWALKNKDSRNEWQREYFRILRSTDPNYKVVSCCRSRISSVLRTGSKVAHTYELLGMSAEMFREYIGSLFTEGMTWKAFLDGEVELDHIRPVASFDFDNPINQYICFNYRNHQPLWCADNRSKSDKWSKTNQILWNNTIGKEIKEDLLARGIIDSSYEGC